MGFQPGNFLENFYIILIFFTFIYSTFLPLHKSISGLTIIMWLFGVLNLLIVTSIIIENIPAGYENGQFK